MSTPARPPRAGWAGWSRPGVRWGIGLLMGALALVALVVFFPWDWLRGPLNRYVSERTGRHFEITRRLDVRLGRTVQVRADGVVFANPAWAQEPYLVRADRAEVALRLWPLLRGRLEMPRVRLVRPHLGLQLQPDGRRTWVLSPQGDGERTARVELLEVDQGSVRFLAPRLGADIRADVAIDEAGELPLRFQARGRWRDQPFTARGRTSSVMALEGPPGHGFELDVATSAGGTVVQATGTVRSLLGFDGADLQVRLRGRSLANLYPIVPVVLPATPPFAVGGRLQRQGERWRASGLAGTLGRTDVVGDLVYDHSHPVPLLTGELRSRLLNFDDLGPVVGVPPTARQPQPAAVSAPSARGPGRRVLPDKPLDLERLNAMNADVRYDAARVVNARGLPLDRLSAHVRLQGGVLDLEPLQVGVADGQLAGRVRIDASRAPVALQVDLRALAIALERLLPATRTQSASVGRLQGRIVLAGRGPSFARLLGSSSGEVSLLMGPGRISNLMLEVAGLDGAEIVKFMRGHDQQVSLRCAAAGFAVKDGLMGARILVLDTTDTVIWGQGSINLATEALDLTFRPQPKDVSILTLRSPLRLAGTLGAPQASVQAGALAARAGAVVALGVINPLLGLAATVETGPGKDVDCAAVLQQAAAPAAIPAAPATLAASPARR